MIKGIFSWLVSTFGLLYAIIITAFFVFAVCVGTFVKVCMLLDPGPPPEKDKDQLFKEYRDYVMKGEEAIKDCDYLERAGETTIHEDWIEFTGEDQNWPML